MINKNPIINIIGQIAEQVGPLISSFLDEDTSVALIFGKGGAQSFFLEREELKDPFDSIVREEIFDKNPSISSGVFDKAKIEALKNVADMTSILADLIKDSTIDEEDKKELLKKIDVLHSRTGKLTDATLDEIPNKKDALNNLNFKLKKALENENYAKAAELRDEIKKHKNE